MSQFGDYDKFTRFRSDALGVISGRCVFANTRVFSERRRVVVQSALPGQKTTPGAGGELSTKL